MIVAPVGNMQGSPSLRMNADMNINASSGTSGAHSMMLNQTLSSHRTTANTATTTSNPSISSMQHGKPSANSLKRMSSSPAKSLDPNDGMYNKKRKAKLMHGKGQWNPTRYYRNGGGYDPYNAPHILDQHDPNYDSEDDAVLEEHVFDMEDEDEYDYENGDHGDLGNGLRMVQSEPADRGNGHE